MNSKFDNTFNSFTISNSILGIALEDYDKNGKVKIFIPTLLALMDKSRVYENNEKIKSKNIENKNPIEYNNRASVRNYIELSSEFEGKKDDKFIISFLEGNINYPYIVRRY